MGGKDSYMGDEREKKNPYLYPMLTMFPMSLFEIRCVCDFKTFGVIKILNCYLISNPGFNDCWNYFGMRYIIKAI